jgi:hypothetical protein
MNFRQSCWIDFQQAIERIGQTGGQRKTDRIVGVSNGVQAGVGASEKRAASDIGAKAKIGLWCEPIMLHNQQAEGIGPNQSFRERR